MNIFTISKTQLAELLSNERCWFQIDSFTGEINYFINTDYKGNIIPDCDWSDEIFVSKLCNVKDLLTPNEISYHIINKIFQKETLKDHDFNKMIDYFLFLFKNKKYKNKGV